MCEQVTTVSIDRLGNYAYKCTEQEMREIDLALLVSIGICISEIKGFHKAAEETEDAPHTKAQPIEEAYCEKDIETARVVATAQAERDTYKAMYENLLQMVVCAQNSK